MDNHRFDITADKGLSDWIRCCCARRISAVGWSTHPPEGDKPARLVFYWMESKAPGFTNLPFRADAAEVFTIAERWLAQSDYGPQPGHDGDNGKGFRLYNERWGHVDGRHEAFLAVSPAWAMYGK